MLKSLAQLILKYRIAIIISISLITIFMGIKAFQIELSYNFIRPLPKEDSTLVNYDNFKKLFGEDGNVMVIGIQDSSIYDLKKFNGLYDLTYNIKKITGIKNVLSLSNLYSVCKNDSLQKFDIKQIISSKPKSQIEVDSIKKVIESYPFYKGIIYNPETHAALILVTFEDKNLNSAARITVVHQIQEITKQFSISNKVNVYYSGMPFIRTRYMEKISQEMLLFMILAIVVTLLIVLFIFKSLRVALYALVVVIIGIIWSLGTLYLFGYKITILTGLIPSIITVIGLPNCVFIINKYLVEINEHGKKDEAVLSSFYKVALSNFLANVTTAIGFFVFYFTHSTLLVEFGVVSAINVMATFAVAHLFIPIILSYTPLPKKNQTKHITGKYISKVLEVIDHLVHKKRLAIYGSIAFVTVVAFFGWTFIRLLGYVVDDLPKNDPIYTDLRFFEKNFNGVLPFEICIDTKRDSGVFKENAKTLYKIRAMEKVMAKYPEFSKPLSIVEGVKFAYQAYNEGKPKFYILPDLKGLSDIKSFTETLKGKESKFTSFIDSSKRYTRVSYQMADVGSIRLKQIVQELQPKIDSIFATAEYNVSITGNSIVFLKGNDYLFHHLFIALAIAIVLILLLGIVLFRSVAIIVLSKLPCLIPLAITAGIMGFFNIPFKPSTIIIFTIAFGLSSDGTIYILAEYWNQLRKNANDPEKANHAISNTIKEVGVSMIYTGAILFCGFAIFIASGFGGTVALGVLMSITIAVSLATNLILLPSLLLTLEKWRAKKNINSKLIH